MKKGYIVGLDIGTSSVGWSVQDENNNVLKFNGKKMWGVRLFEEGKTAVKRREFRSTRRRLQRRKYRLTLFRQLVEQEIFKKDKTFFLRLEESFKIFNDKEFKNRYNIFVDEKWNDKDYYKEFPTIYHLRNYLMDNEEEDIRLIYLAIHHILKYRGNFLHENQNFEIENIDIVSELKKTLGLFENQINIKIINELLYNNIERILLDKDLTNREKSEKLVNELSSLFIEKKCLKAFVNLIIGLSSELTILFNLDEIEPEDKKILKVKFGSKDYEEKLDDVLKLIGDCDSILDQCKILYNTIFLKKIFVNVREPRISEVMIKRFEKHGRELKAIKNLVKTYGTKEDKDFFKTKKGENNFDYYINHPSKFEHDKLLIKLKNMLEKYKVINDKSYNNCLKEIEKGDFLKILNIKENGIYPYQVHLYELNKIIERQSNKHPILKENADKIISLLKFRIPYYVGPLNPTHTKKEGYFSWVVRKEKGAVTPWNFHNKIDVDASAEKFITSMTNYCSYFLTEKVIPKNSLLYTKYMVLSEIKQIKVNKHFLSPIYFNNLLEEFIFGPKVNMTKADLEKWLAKNKIEVEELTGFQKENGFATNMKPYRDFIEIFTTKEQTREEKLNFIKKNYEMIENLIEWITLFEDKTILKKRIKQNYPRLTNKEIQKIANLNYPGWGRFSRKFLTEKYLNYEEGLISMLKLMEITSENMIQIINDDKYGFSEYLLKINYGEEKQDLVYDDIKALPGSPAIKKGIWQSILIVKEIIDIMGNNPQKIYLEMARYEGTKKRTKTRYEQIKELYKDSNQKPPVGLNELEKKLKNNRYYLYFLQHGKCLYCNKAINIGEVDNESLYEIDHIIPRYLIKDDSLDNLALVHRECNQKKYIDNVLDISIISKQTPIWRTLLENQFISSKKFYNLTRQKFNPKDIEGFVKRQLVETRQITKHVVNLLDNYLGPDIVATIKANLISDFREKYKIYKIRELNNFHHAIDAYLCAVIGNHVIKTYPKMKRDLLYSEFQRYSRKRNGKNIKRDYGFILKSFENEKYDEDTGELISEKWLKNIINHANYQDINVTKKTEINNGEFYNQTIYSPKSSGATSLIELKENKDPLKYGGYNHQNYAYHMLIEYQKGKKKEKAIISIPVRIHVSKDKKELLKKYLNDKLKITNYLILKEKILKNQLIKANGQYIYLISQDEVVNANELRITKEEKQILYENLNGKINIENLNKSLLNILIRNSKYYPFFKTTISKLINFIEDDQLTNLTEEKIREFIIKFLKIFNPNGGTINLAKITNDAKEKYLFNTEMSRLKKKIKTGVLIYPSITGLRRKTYEF